MERLPTLHDYFSALSSLDESTALSRIYDVSKALLTVNFKQNILAHTIHNDVKPENMVIDDQYGGLELTTGGLLDTATSRVRCKYIDFGHATLNVPNQFLRPTTFEYSSPEQLVGSPKLKNSIANDIYATGCLLLILTNGGVNHWHWGNGKSLQCPNQLMKDLAAAVNFDHMRLSDNKDDSDDSRKLKAAYRRRALTALYRYIVLLYTKNEWVLADLIEMCPALEGVLKEIAASDRFKKHVQLFSLVEGTKTIRIRTCPIFKSVDAALLGFFSILQPWPHCRWLPEQFIQLLVDVPPMANAHVACIRTAVL